MTTTTYQRKATTIQALQFTAAMAQRFIEWHLRSEIGDANWRREEAWRLELLPPGVEYAEASGYRLSVPGKPHEQVTFGSYIVLDASGVYHVETAEEFEAANAPAVAEPVAEAAPVQEAAIEVAPPAPVAVPEAPAPTVAEPKLGKPMRDKGKR